MDKHKKAKGNRLLGKYICKQNFGDRTNCVSNNRTLLNRLVNLNRFEGYDRLKNNEISF